MPLTRSGVLEQPIYYQPIAASNAGKIKGKSHSLSDIESVVFYMPVESLGSEITNPLVGTTETRISNGDVVMVIPNTSPPVIESNSTMAFTQNPAPAFVSTSEDPIEENLVSIAVSSSSSPRASATISSPVISKPQVKRPADKSISTLVFFDLETTGLAHEIGKSNVQITEISMIAIQKKEFQDSTSSELKDIRIIQKLCLCVRPRSRVSLGAAKVTGLDDYKLIEQHPFNQNAAAVFTSFLTHLPQPVCLLAHNGASYDFPLLKAEFKKLSIQLPSDILIADTLCAFRELGVPVFPSDKKVCKAVKFNRTGQVSYALANLHLYFFNKKPTGSHSSEGDCIALAKVCHRMKDVILPWFDENSSTMDTVTPMW